MLAGHGFRPRGTTKAEILDEVDRDLHGDAGADAEKAGRSGAAPLMIEAAGGGGAGSGGKQRHAAAVITIDDDGDGDSDYEPDDGE